jgi:thiamine kinase-like enzyme
MTESLELKFQESGLTNRNYVVSNGLEKVVVRVNGAHTGLLGINRQAELAAMEAVSDLKTAPELLYFDVEQGYMMTRFIEGRTWESNDLDMNVDRIGVLLKKVHTAAEIDFEFSPYKDIETWIQKAQSRGQQLPDSLDERLHRIQALRAAASDNFRGLCHNDPFANNFMDDDRFGYWIGSSQGWATSCTILLASANRWGMTSSSSCCMPTSGIHPLNFYEHFTIWTMSFLFGMRCGLSLCLTHRHRHARA